MIENVDGFGPISIWQLGSIRIAELRRFGQNFIPNSLSVKKIYIQGAWLGRWQERPHIRQAPVPNLLCGRNTHYRSGWEARLRSRQNGGTAPYPDGSPVLFNTARDRCSVMRPTQKYIYILFKIILTLRNNFG